MVAEKRAAEDKIAAAQALVAKRKQQVEAKRAIVNKKRSASKTKAIQQEKEVDVDVRVTKEGQIEVKVEANGELGPDELRKLIEDVKRKIPGGKDKKARIEIRIVDQETKAGSNRNKGQRLEGRQMQGQRIEIERRREMGTT